MTTAMKTARVPRDVIADQVHVLKIAFEYLDVLGGGELRADT
jgi:hypothetical protein